jgi:hypothetical protein
MVQHLFYLSSSSMTHASAQQEGKKDTIYNTLIKVYKNNMGFFQSLYMLLWQEWIHGLDEHD